MKLTLPQFRSSGTALVITLSFVVLITVLVVALSDSMRVERQAANSYLERKRASLMAQAGVEMVVAKLQQTTSDAERYWISQPGQLLAGPADDGGGSADKKVLEATPIPLTSGVPMSTPSQALLMGPNLNFTAFRPPYDNLITSRVDSGGTPLQMRLKWLYLRNDGSEETSEAPDFGLKDNPIVGRYAYWTDDESAKVNYNLAWGRGPGNTNPVGHPTRVDLSALEGITPAQADLVHGFIADDANFAALNKGFFNSPEDARRIAEEPDGAPVAAALETNRFEVTHFNHDPDTTFFNEPRIVLTTLPNRAGWIYEGGRWVGKNGKSGKDGRPYYIRVLTDAAENQELTPSTPLNPALDPGLDASLDQNKVYDLLQMLNGSSTAYLSRADWPIAPGSSFQAKYGNAKRLTQLAFNLIDYVRARESAQPQVEPLRGRYLAGQSFLKGTVFLNDDNCFMSVTRTICITELGMYVASDPAQSKLVLELYLPASYGVAEIDVRDLYIWGLVNRVGQPNGATWNSELKIQEAECSKDPSVNGPAYLLRAGERMVVTRTINTGSPRQAQMQLRVALSIAIDSRRVDLVPFLGTDRVTVPVDATTVLPSDITSVEVNDPRVNKNKDAWLRRDSGNSFGRPNNGQSGGQPIYTVGQTPMNISPQQDTGADGSISDASLYMPAVAGTLFLNPDGTQDDNRDRRVTSAGEIGFLHTGVEIATGAGIPWRTVRLQPSKEANTVVPDWALMDLFTPPVDVHANARFLYAPHGTAVGGRVNVNSRAQPFDMERILPLAAVFANVRHTSGSQAKLPVGSLGDTDTPSFQSAVQLARNIYYAVDPDQASGRMAASGKQYGLATAYDSPGEIVEVRGIADAGERSEELVRNVSNLITARGSVFSIYTVGQALKQTDTGKIVITGEQRLQVMLERYRELDTNEVRFAPIYYRTLTP